MAFAETLHKNASGPSPLQWFAILSFVAVLLALGLPPDPKDLQQLHITSGTYRLAIAALLIPYVLIWYASFYAYAKLQEYSRPLKGTKDGNAFGIITRGMGILSFALVIPTIVSLVLNNIAMHNRSWEGASIVIDNYMPLYFGMVAFLVLYNGARALLYTVRSKTKPLDLRVHAPWFLLLSVVFTYLTVENHSNDNPYHLPLWALLTTYIVPFLYGWALGLLCARNLTVYAKTVKGSLYRRAIRQVAVGIAVAIIASISIQFVTATLASRFEDSLGAILLIDYILLAIVALGLILIAFGTKKLKLLEEV